MKKQLPPKSTESSGDGQKVLGRLIVGFTAELATAITPRGGREFPEFHETRGVAEKEAEASGIAAIMGRKLKSKYDS